MVRHIILYFCGAHGAVRHKNNETNDWGWQGVDPTLCPVRHRNKILSIRFFLLVLILPGGSQSDGAEDDRFLAPYPAPDA
jgi:hypothetical protein